jgi:hypothetical protein
MPAKRGTTYKRGKRNEAPAGDAEAPSTHLTSYETHKRAIRLKPLLLEETPKIFTTQGATAQYTLLG